MFSVAPLAAQPFSDVGSGAISVTISNGVSATGAIGTDFSITGVGNVTESGLAATGAVGTGFSFSITGTAEPSGVDATGAIGNVVAGALVTVNATGVSATGSIGTSTFSIVGSVQPTGTDATGAIGYDEGLSIDGSVTPTGLAGTMSTGSVVASLPKIVTLTGANSVVGTTALGEETITQGVSQDVTGVEATGQTGAGFRIGGDTKVTITTGVSGTGQTGKMLLWELVVSTYDPNWSEIRT